MNPGEEDPLKLWQHVHGASSHFPIALVIVAVLFELGAVMFKKPAWRIVGFWAIFTAALLSVPAILSGLTGFLGWFGFTPHGADVSDHVVLHRNVSLVGGGVLILLAAWRVGREKAGMKSAEHATYLVLLIAATLIIGYAGWLGAYVGHGY